MDNYYIITDFLLGSHTIQLYIPDPLQVQQNYQQSKMNGDVTDFPYWAKLWPSSIALCEFLFKNNHYIRDKKILEIAAGLGLPSLFAAGYAEQVVYSDYISDPIAFVQASAKCNKIDNLQCEIINWNNLPPGITTDVLLLSDVNYEPLEFEQLFGVLKGFLERATTIILSTPQRLMAKQFIEKILEFCIEKEDILVDETLISVFVLKR